MGLLPPVVMELRAKATEVYSELGKVRSEMGKTATETEAGGGRMSRAFKGAGAAGGAITAGVVGAGIAIAGFSLEAATASQVTEARLSTALKNVGADAEKFKPQMEEAADGVVKFGYSNNQGQQALANLTTALGDPKKAMADLTVAANLAREKNISLQDSAMLVAKASEGQVRPLRALGIDLPVYAGNAQAVALANQKLKDAQQKVTDILAKTPDAANTASKAHAKYEQAVGKVTAAQALLTSKQASGDKIMQTLTERVKGQAAAYGNTLKGKLDSAKASLEGVAEKIGGYLIPIVEKAAKGVQDIVGWLVKNRTVAIALGVVIGVVAGTLMAVYVAQKLWAAGMVVARIATVAWSAAQWVLNAAMDANPIGLIVLAVIALIAIIILLVTHWKEVTSFLTTVWKNVAGFFIAVGAQIAAWWNGFWAAIGAYVTATFGPPIAWLIRTWQITQIVFAQIGAMIAAGWNGLWSTVGSVVSAAWGFITSFVSGQIHAVWSVITGVGSAISGAWNGIWSGMGRIVSSAFSGISGIVRGAINGVIGAINGAIDGINSMKRAAGPLGGLIPSLGHIPSLDIGGWVPGGNGKPVLALNHGGEYMLSTDMLSGRVPISPDVASRVARNAAAYGGGGRPPGRGRGSRGSGSTNITVQTNATGPQIAAALHWEHTRAGGIGD